MTQDVPGRLARDDQVRLTPFGIVTPKKIFPKVQTPRRKVSGIDVLTARENHQGSVILEPAKPWTNVLASYVRFDFHRGFPSQLEVLGHMTEVTTEPHLPVSLTERINYLLTSRRFFEQVAKVIAVLKESIQIVFGIFWSCR
jgi:hypothetical protein